MAENLEIEDFSGGITDYYLNAPNNKLKACDNLLLIQYPEAGKPFTRPGSTLFSTTAPQIPAGAQRISTSLLYKNVFHVQSSKKLYWYDATVWSTASGPTGNNAFENSDTNTALTYGTWNNHVIWGTSAYDLPLKSYINATGDVTAVTAGLPVAPTPVLGASTAGANNWLYKFVYKYTYTTADGLTFIDYGTPSPSLSVTAKTTPNTLTWTVPTNTTEQNYDWASTSMKMALYRTLNNGTVFYLVAQGVNVSAGTQVDVISDAVLATREVLYTTGGVVANDAPPRAALTHIFGDIAYYGRVKEGSSFYKYRWYQSVPGDIDAVPATFFGEIDDEIVAMSSTKSNLVLLCQGSVYRVDGFFDELGRGGMTAERISDTATCCSPQGAVQAHDGVFWAGIDGVWYTDGFRVLKLNGDYDKTWKTFVYHAGLLSSIKQSRIQGKFDRRKNRIWWTVATDGVEEVDLCYILDLNYGIRENATFTTCSGLGSFAPTSIEFDNGELLRSDKRGYVLRHKDTLYSDLKIDTGVSPSLWVKQTIFYDLESIAFNFGSSRLRKYVTGINLVADSLTNLSLQITSDNDDNRSVADLLPIRYRGNVVWGDPDIYWGDPSVTWNLDGLIAEKRRMPAKNLRCSYKSISFRNANVVILTSDLLGTADVNATLKTVTLTDTATYDWPTNAIDWYVSFAQDGYEREYLITLRTDDVLTYEDLAGTTMDATATKWEIRGYPKDEILNLLNYSIHYEVFGQTQDVFNTADKGSVSE